MAPHIEEQRRRAERGMKLGPPWKITLTDRDKITVGSQTP